MPVQTAKILDKFWKLSVRKSR